jgi:hypothetical protein
MYGICHYQETKKVGLIFKGRKQYTLEWLNSNLPEEKDVIGT